MAARCWPRRAGRTANCCGCGPLAAPRLPRPMPIPISPANAGATRTCGSSRSRVHCRTHSSTAGFYDRRLRRPPGDTRMGFSILIVDDEPDLPELFRQRFRREVRHGQYVLHFAASGEEGLLRLVELGPELIVILSDINMPGMDGLALLREIKRRRPELAVVMVTAYGDAQRMRTATELGAAAFLAKPVDFDQL